MDKRMQLVFETGSRQSELYDMLESMKAGAYPQDLKGLREKLTRYREDAKRLEEERPSQRVLSNIARIRDYCNQIEEMLPKIRRAS